MSYLKNIQIGEINTLIESFDSTNEAVIKNSTRSITDKNFHNMHNKECSKSFEFVKSFSEAEDLLKYGYNKNIDKIELSISKSLSGVHTKSAFKADIMGFVPIVPHVLMGIPNQMVNTYKKPVKNKVIDIYYDMTCRAGTSPKNLEKCGQHLIEAVAVLEKYNYKVNLYSIQNYSDSGISHIMCVKIKDSKTPFNIKRMTFSIMHPAFFRVIGFDWYSRVPNGKYLIGYGHSLAYDLSRDEFKDFIKKAVNNDNAIALSSTWCLDHSKEEFLNEITGGAINGK